MVSLHMVSLPKDDQLRPWRVIAQELANETDADKVLALAQELGEALRRDHDVNIGDFQPHQTEII